MSGFARDTIAAFLRGLPPPRDIDRAASAKFPVFSFFKPKPDTDLPRPDAPAMPAPELRPSWAQRLKAGLGKTREQFTRQVAELFSGGKIDEALYEELETALISADCGVDATAHLLAHLRAEVKRRKLDDAAQLRAVLRDALTTLLATIEQPLACDTPKPFIILLCGVNGAGKTTTIGKLAHQFQAEGKTVMLAAGDTFRAAAREQLAVWGERNGVTVISQDGGDAAAVIFDAVQSARARGIDVLLADTAGRLPTQLHLMEEIRKVKRVIAKADPSGPHEVLLVLDANTGQNAIAQVRAFDDALGLTGLALTKLDGTAKGGVLAALARTRPIPVRFIGVGEGVEDLKPFVAREFVDALLPE
jgi:fused signal recognition particle receptor